MLKMSYAGCPGTSPAISMQFTLKICVVARNCKKVTKNPYFAGSRSSTLTSITRNLSKAHETRESL